MRSVKGIYLFLIDYAEFISLHVVFFLVIWKFGKNHFAEYFNKPFEKIKITIYITFLCTY